MSTRIDLQAKVDDYLAERHRLGFKLENMGLFLASFTRYATSVHHQGPLTVELMANWARQDKSQSHKPGTGARRLKSLRPFTRWLRQFEPQTEVPDESVFGPVPGRVTPHIYRETEIVDLLAAARGLKPKGGLRPATFETLFGLIASTGLRVSEALALLDVDVDLTAGTLTVRQTKFAKSRLLPLHPSTVKALFCYRQLRSRQVPTATDSPFFICTRGRRLGQPLGDRQVHRIFIELRDQLGWIDRGAHGGPRIHDMRHNSESRIIPHTDLRGLKSPESTQSRLPPMRNNQRLFKNASRRSLGWKRGSRTSLVATLASAFSLSCMSAWK